MQAAVHQRAVFTLTGKYAPLNRDYLGGGKEHPGYPAYPDYWDPFVNVDIVLRSTKPANSVIAETFTSELSTGSVALPGGRI